MKKQLLIFPILISFFVSVSAQTKEAQKLFDVVYPIPCSQFNALMDSAYQNYLQKFPDAKLYVIFYGARYARVGVWNSKTRNYDKIRLLNPAQSDAFNRAKEVPLYLETVYKFPEDKIVLLTEDLRKILNLKFGSFPKMPSRLNQIQRLM